MQERIIVPLAFLGVFCILLQILGIFSPAWMIYSFGKKHDSSWDGYSLWTNSVSEVNTTDLTETVTSTVRNRSIIFSNFSTVGGEALRNLSETIRWNDDFGATTNVTHSFLNSSVTGSVHDNSTVLPDADVSDNSRNDTSASIDASKVTANKSDIYSWANERTNDTNTDISNSSVTAFFSITTATNDRNYSANDSGISIRTRLEVRMGLWSRSACIYWSESQLAEAFVEDCKSEPTLKLDKILSDVAFSTNKTVINQLIGNWEAVRGLIISSLVFAICGVVLLFVFSKWHEKKVVWIWALSATSWFISGVLGLAGAVKTVLDIQSYSKQLHDVSYMGMEYSVRFSVPWATVVSTVGGIFALLIALRMTYLLLRRKSRTSLDLYIPLVNVNSSTSRKCILSQDHMSTFL